MKQVRKRLTYANVMSSIAVFLVVGGATAFAALGKNTVGTKQLKKNAVTAAKLKKNAVTTAKLKNMAVTGPKVQLSSLGTVPSAASATNSIHANSATNADNASSLGGASASSYQKTGDLLFATIAPAGPGAKVIRGRGVTSVGAGGEGEVDVKFNRDITGCTWLATYGPPGNQFVDDLHATVRGRPASDEVLVVIYNENEEEKFGSGVHVEALCP
jgi:hypothetical protein